MVPKKPKKTKKQHVKVLAKIPVSSKKLFNAPKCANPHLPEPCDPVQDPGCPISEEDGCKKGICESGGCMTGCEGGGCTSSNMA